MTLNWIQDPHLLFLYADGPRGRYCIYGDGLITLEGSVLGRMSSVEEAKRACEYDASLLL